MKFPIKDFVDKCDEIRSFLWIWSHVLKKSLMENFIFCPVITHTKYYDMLKISNRYLRQFINEKRSFRLFHINYAIETKNWLKNP